MAEYSYRVRIEKETTPALQELAKSLGFVATTPGKYLGAPSPGSLLDALAAVYRANPMQTRRVLQSLMAAHDLLPDAQPDATPPTE